MIRRRHLIAMTVVATILPAAVQAQSPQDRIRNTGQAQPVQTLPGQRVNPEFRLREVVQAVELEGVPAQRAFEWWSLTTGVPLVINWEALEAAGVDRNEPITLRLRTVPAGQLLALMMRKITPELSTLIYQTTPWYVELLTREQALKRTVVRVYVIDDLLMEIPRFTQAPEFDLNSALSNTSSGGSAGAGVAQASTSIFDDEDDDKEEVKTKAERGLDIAELIMDTIEPDIWVDRGGQYASVRYFAGRLIVSAPLFVHDQIGIPAAGGSALGPGRAAAGMRMKGVAGVGD